MDMSYYQIQRKQKPNFLNYTLKIATKMLLSFTSNYSFNNIDTITVTNKLKEYFRFSFLLLTWFSTWLFRVGSDIFLPSLSAPRQLPPRGRDLVRRRCTVLPALDNIGGGGGGGSELLAVGSGSTSSSLVPYSSYGLLMEMDGSDYRMNDGVRSVQALGRALSHVLALLNELPSTSRKYEFAMAMADRILDDNTREGHTELLLVNRVSLSTAFEFTTILLHDTLNTIAISQADQFSDSQATWSTRLIKKLPLGSYINAYMKGGLMALLPALEESTWQLEKRSVVFSRGDLNNDDFDNFEHAYDHSADVVKAEKLAQELMWIINKLRACRAECEALVQWSLASGMASLSLNANPRVQALLIKITASLLGDVARAEYEVPTQVQYRLLVLWLPLFCYTSTALRYPVLSTYEKIEVERTIERMIDTLSDMEQEIVLRNWFEDYTIGSSDWPNLLPSYDRWCQYSRQRVM